MSRWSIHHERCSCCKRTVRPHCAFGLCAKCYNSFRCKRDKNPVHTVADFLGVSIPPPPLAPEPTTPFLSVGSVVEVRQWGLTGKVLRRYVHCGYYVFDMINQYDQEILAIPVKQESTSRVEK